LSVKGIQLSMTQKKQQNLFNLSDKLILLYGTPLLLWPISLLGTFNISEKLSITLLFIIMLVGLELLFRNHNISVKKIYKRKLKAIDDLNVSFSFFLTPQIFITSILAMSFGGIIGFYFINNDFFSFISIASIFFTIILGFEFLFQDLLIKPLMKTSKIETKNKLIFKADFIDYLIHFLPFLYYIYKHPIMFFYGIFGFLLTFNFYYTDLFSLVFGTLMFIVIGYGISSLKNSK